MNVNQSKLVMLFFSFFCGRRDHEADHHQYLIRLDQSFQHPDVRSAYLTLPSFSWVLKTPNWCVFVWKLEPHTMLLNIQVKKNELRVWTSLKMRVQSYANCRLSLEPLSTSVQFYVSCHCSYIKRVLKVMIYVIKAQHMQMVNSSNERSQHVDEEIPNHAFYEIIHLRR